MEKTGHIEIRVSGKKGNLDINPDNYDIKDLIEVLQNTENLLFSDKKGRPLISYAIQEGSVRHIIKTSMQAVISFNAILSQIQSGNSIDFLEYPTAKAFEYFQESAKKQNVFFDIATSIPGTARVTINSGTKFFRSDDVWVETELYFYGIVTDAGGKSIANLHLDTKEFGLLKIGVDKEFLANYGENPLYKPYGVRASGKQNLKTGEFDKSTLHLLEVIDYSPSSKEDYLNELIKKASKSWADVSNTDDWLKELRGYGA